MVLDVLVGEGVVIRQQSEPLLHVLSHVKVLLALFFLSAFGLVENFPKELCLLGVVCFLEDLHEFVVFRRGSLVFLRLPLMP